MTGVSRYKRGNLEAALFIPVGYFVADTARLFGRNCRLDIFPAFYELGAGYSVQFERERRNIVFSVLPRHLRKIT